MLLFLILTTNNKSINIVIYLLRKNIKDLDSSIIKKTKKE